MTISRRFQEKGIFAGKAVFRRARLSPAENVVKQFHVTLEIVQYLGRCESGLDVFNQTELIGRRIDSVGYTVHPPDDFLAAFGKDKVYKQVRRVWMRSFRGDSGGVNIGEDGIQIDPI